MQGLMGDVGTAAQAGQAFEQEKQRTELGNLQLLMAKNKIQQEQDTAVAMKSAVASENIRASGYSEQLQTWGKVYKNFIAAGNLTGADLAEKEMKRIQEAAGNEQKQSEKQKFDMQESAADSARKYIAMKSGTPKGQVIDPAMRQDVIENVRKFDPNTASRLENSTPSQFDSMMKIIEKGGMTSLQINEEQRKAEEYAQNQQRLQQKQDQDAQIKILDASSKANARSGAGPHKVSAVQKMVSDQITRQMNEAQVAVKNLSQLTDMGKTYVTSGPYENLTDHGIMSASTKVLGQKITPTDQQMYNSIILPLARISAIMQNPRYATREGAVKQAQSEITALAGQSHMTMLEKMGELKQQIITSAEAQIASGDLNPEQEAMVKNGMDNINKYIPWNVEDVIKFSKTKGEAKNFGQWLKEQRGEKPTPQIKFLGFK